ncbi:PD-(D/E)XK nuclease family protein [Noviherbaspirillum cavernae]|uniref:PD-(D/E)XK nuclease family protein n=1 Tax=Noviherbaspirillum cavernae TaxID=2320862 RepID=A0A418WYL7_9BURK|nr:PD-(D/E)XK nuclease family protein [Noviherbaspirillum cavernae]RJG05344.1 PD-(D/E)XK nuclease family protein [Noviherbaspirillum cavernae]
MLQSPLLIAPAAGFWSQTARILLDHGMLSEFGDSRMQDFSAIRIVVPSFSHAPFLKAALAERLQHAFIPPRITTLQAWLAMAPPDSAEAQTVSDSERLMELYAELRQHGWLKKLFAARRNTDLLPLAQTLLTLFDELTRALLPSIQLSPDAAEARWQAALEQIAPAARSMLSDEAQLVWSLWKSQLDTSDPTARRFARMMRLAEQADAPLVWIGAVEADAMENAFLAAYGARQPVVPVRLDWRASAIEPVCALAWREILDDDESIAANGGECGAAATPAGVTLCATGSLEDEAVRGAQTIIDWLQQGKSSVAVIAQDRVVARRIRALLERAQIQVSDETGWKLSTTRTASALAALLDAVATRAETSSLLDLLKSPFLFAEVDGKSERVMAIEHALRRANVLGGWESAVAALSSDPLAQDSLQRIAQQARHFTGRKTLSEWITATYRALDALGMHAALAVDAAGMQVIAMLETLKQDCASSSHAFSFAEWRAFIGLQLESTPFVPADFDRRVVMLQLNGARLRAFDAVLMVGADADHLPSQLDETLFFANAVRRELGLATREMRHRAQLRDFAELLTVNREVVLSWQTFTSGEPNPPSPWIERLQLALERAGAAPLPMHRVEIAPHLLTAQTVAMPAPVAPHLVPSRLSASGYNSLVACPYQFFATRMLELQGMDELSDMPEKRDYGDWLHRILTTYHETLRDNGSALQDRASLLQQISQQVFDDEIARSGAALGYYSRWQKAMPAYLEWANARESEGWHFVMGEGKFDKTLHWEDGKITLHGRIDRIDENGAGERAVLDYKTKNSTALRDRLKEGEDHQLAFYGLLSDRPVAHASYVALEPVKDKTGAVDAPNYEEWQRALQAQVVANMHAIAGGAPLRASGINRVCGFCEVRGLCRKGAWE